MIVYINFGEQVKYPNDYDKLSDDVLYALDWESYLENFNINEIYIEKNSINM